MSRGFLVNLDFEVGQAEKHRVTFHYNQFWGNLAIAVDGATEISDLRMFSVSLAKTYRFSVGVNEHHDVIIEKTRRLFFPGFRPQVVRAWVDGTFVGQDQSLGAPPVGGAVSS